MSKRKTENIEKKRKQIEEEEKEEKKEEKKEEREEKNEEEEKEEEVSPLNIELDSNKNITFDIFTSIVTYYEKQTYINMREEYEQNKQQQQEENDENDENDDDSHSHEENEENEEEYEEDNSNNRSNRDEWSRRRKPERIIGDLVWNYLKNIYQTDELFNNQYRITLDLINESIKGFSDYREIFSVLFDYIIKGIEFLSPEIAVKCAETCHLMYSTNEVNTFYHPEWINVILQRSIEILINTLTLMTELINDHNLKQQYENQILIGIGSVFEMIILISESGDRYLNEFNNSPLKESIYDLIQQIQQLFNQLNSSNIILYIDEQIKGILSLTSPTIEKSLNVYDSSTNNNQNNEIIVNNTNNITTITTNETENKNITELINYKQVFQGLNKKITAKMLLNAYNSMCELTSNDIELQLKSVTNELTIKSISIIHEMNEGFEDKTEILIEALMYLSLLLDPFTNDLPNHTDYKETKTSITLKLIEYGIFEGLMKQVELWVNEWNEMFGDCGRGVFLCFKHLQYNLPEVYQSKMALYDQKFQNFIQHNILKV